MRRRIARGVGVLAVAGVAGGFALAAVARSALISCNDAYQVAINTATDGQVINVGGCAVALSVTNPAAFSLQGNGTAIWTPANSNTPMLSSSAAARFTVAGITFENGSASGSGGAISISNADAAPTISNDTFLANHAGVGGAVSLNIQNGTTTRSAVIDGNTFGAIGQGNSASGDGGAIYYLGTGALQVTNNTFTANTANFGGALVTAGGKPITLSGNTFGGSAAGAGNGAVLQGGGAVIQPSSGGSLVLAHNRFVDNTLSGTDFTGGGAGLSILGSGTTLTQSDNLFSGNTDTSSTTVTMMPPQAGGGGESLMGVNATSRRDVFTGNRVATSGGEPPEGGGLALLGTLDAAGDVFSGNSVGTTGSGGGIATGTSACSMCVSHLTLRDSTVSGNSVDAGTGSQGAAISGSPHDTLAVDNSIVVGNTTPTGGLFPPPEIAGFGGGSLTFTFTDVCTAPGSGTPVVGSGNICADPQLHGSGEETASSPTIDKGSNALVPADVTTDFEGNPRFVAGLCGDAAIVDMGAFESPAPACSPTSTTGGSGGGQTGGSVGAAPGMATPAITALAQSASVWREGSKLAQISAKKKPPVGTTFSFDLNEQASVRLSFTQRAPGRKVRGTCVARSTKSKHKPRCTRTVVAGALRFTAHQGTNKIHFDGRLSRTTKLKPGRYTLTITATNTAGQHTTARPLSFTIVK